MVLSVCKCVVLFVLFVLFVFLLCLYFLYFSLAFPLSSPSFYLFPLLTLCFPLQETDYEWLTQQVVECANVHCEGRIVSCLEGGYRIHGNVVSAFARSAAAHVRALASPGKWCSSTERVAFDAKVDEEVDELE